MSDTTTKRNIRPGVDFERFDEVNRRAPEGVTVGPLSGFIKVEGPGGQRIYVQKAHTVRQVDLSGFGKGLPGTVPLPSPNGRVEAQLDLSDPEAAIKRYEELVALLPTLPKMVQARKAPLMISTKGKRKGTKPVPGEDRSHLPAIDSEEMLVKRRKTIETTLRYCRDNDKPVSPRTIAAAKELGVSLEGFEALAAAASEEKKAS